jgi:hypothetical protein
LILQKTFGVVVVFLILSSVVALGYGVADTIGAFAQTNESGQGNSNVTNTTSITQLSQTLTKKVKFVN